MLSMNRTATSAENDAILAEMNQKIAGYKRMIWDEFYSVKGFVTREHYDEDHTGVRFERFESLYCEECRILNQFRSRLKRAIRFMKEIVLDGNRRHRKSYHNIAIKFSNSVFSDGMSDERLLSEIVCNYKMAWIAANKKKLALQVAEQCRDVLGIELIKIHYLRSWDNPLYYFRRTCGFIRAFEDRMTKRNW